MSASAAIWAPYVSCWAVNCTKRCAAQLFSNAPDHRILNAALYLRKQSPRRQVILVSKDTNLRMKAKAMGLKTQDYIKDEVESFEKLYTGKRVCENVPSELIDAFYSSNGVVTLEQLAELNLARPRANENFILRNGSKSVLATYRPAESALVRVEKTAAYGIKPRNAEQVVRAAPP